MFLSIILIVLNLITSCLLIRLGRIFRPYKSGSEIQSMIAERLKRFERNDFAFYRDTCHERKKENDVDHYAIFERLKELKTKIVLLERTLKKEV